MQDDNRTLTFTVASMRDIIVRSLTWPSGTVQIALDRVDEGLERMWEKQEWQRNNPPAAKGDGNV